MRTSLKSYGLYCLIASLSACLLPVKAFALKPEEILVVANRNASRSVFLANYYMEKRNIPKKNLLKVWVTDKEMCSREDYDKKVARPVRKYLESVGSGKPIRCIAVMYGLPLRVSPPAETHRKKNGKRGDQADPKQTAAEKEARRGRKTAYTASLDSELALVLEENYDLKGWIDNPHYLGNRGRFLFMEKENVLMVSRLDGPSMEIVKRIIDDAVSVEREGLKGKACFDARWAPPKQKKLGGYAYYDYSIHQAAARVRSSGVMPVVLNEEQELFKPGECPDAALYCGWYRLGKYMDSFTWKRGAVAWHIASIECNTLKRKGSQVWCKRLLEEGVAATIGPVGEPYVQGFPFPDVFFRLLVDGYLTLAECYITSLPFLSWKMVLIGDPLYKPFDVSR